jgi:hypothetical protein
VPSKRLSPEALTVLALLRSDHSSYRGVLARKSGLTDKKIDAAISELERAGVAVAVGRGAVRRVETATPKATKGTNRMSPGAEALFNRLPEDGSRINNLRLKSLLPLDDEAYASAKRELRDKGFVQLGPYGTVGRAPEQAARPSARSGKSRQSLLVARESDLYEPFKRWLETSNEEGGVAFSAVKVTGSPRGHSRESGQWSRPDVCSLQVIRFEWLPDVNVELASYEIKRAGGLRRLESVYEAAAHNRWSHRSSVVVEQEPGGELPPDDAVNQIRQFGLGLYLMTPLDRAEYQVTESVAPVYHGPDPESLNEMLKIILQSDPMIRERYRTAIGR